MSTDLAVNAVHLFATVAMTGVIVFVQIVHYPLFARVGSDAFAAYGAEHVRRTTFVVAPLMLAEVATASWLALAPPAPDLRWATLTGFGLVIVVWLSTALLQIPCHRRLERGFDPAVAARLVATNWVRTLAWAARSALAIYLIVSTPAR